MEYILHLIFTNNLWYTKATEHCVYPHAQLQQSWAHCDQLHVHHNAHWREHCVVLSTLRTVCRCIALMRTLSHVAQVSSVCLHFHPWSSACAPFLECSLHTVSLLRPQVLLPPLPDSCHGAWREFHGRSPVQLQLREHGQPRLCHTRHKSKEADILKRNNEFVFPCRTGVILQDGQPLSTRFVQSAWRLQAISSRQILQRRRSPRSRYRCLKLDNITGVVAEMTCIGIMFQERNSMFRKRFSETFQLHWMCRDKRKRALMYFTRQPSLIIGILMETCHCLNPGSGWQDSNCRTKKNHQKGLCGFTADWQINRLQEDLEL